ncbi:unnamed protein product [Sphenostylis stenocarpa]|uniref:RING-type domain-containing protein n=1 Tax=Sphenostylis stenocarpa TaxID=92480 RepID=A0AA86S385_9FABA|nr:unnamed protein product [Sphenostylis stenocarpa]
MLRLDLNRVPPTEENVRPAHVVVDPNDDDDDDVVELSPRTFAQHRTFIGVQIDLLLQGENKAPEPPKKPEFDCPICMSPFVEPVSTRCGHIFCRECINTAITTQGKCPSCRKKVTRNQPIRIHELVCPNWLVFCDSTGDLCPGLMEENDECKIDNGHIRSNPCGFSTFFTLKNWNVKVHPDAEAKQQSPRFTRLLV